MVLDLCQSVICYDVTKLVNFNHQIELKAQAVGPTVGPTEQALQGVKGGKMTVGNKWTLKPLKRSKVKNKDQK